MSRSRSPALNAAQKASSICGLGGASPRSFGSMSLPRPRCSADLTVPGVVESASAIFLQREVERLLEHHRRALLRREARQERTRRFTDRARLPAGCALRIRFGFRLEGADAVDPQVRRDPEEPRARILGRLIHAPQLRERTEERVLNEIVGVPRTAGQVPAVAVELGAKRLVEIEEAVPRRLEIVAKRVGHFRIGLVHTRATDERGRRIAKPTRVGPNWVQCLSSKYPRPPRAHAALLSVREVAQFLGVSTAIVYRLCDRRELPHLRVSHSIRVALDDLAAYLKP